MMIKSVNAIGVYGGASLNSIELALITTDGIDVQEYIDSRIVPYPEKLALDIRKLISKRGWTFDDLENSSEVQLVRENISTFYAEAINEFTGKDNFEQIGIDGLTIFNDPN